MIAPRNPIFRDKALKHYIQNKKKDVLPHFSSVPAAVFGWLLLGLLIATGLLVNYEQVPVSVTGEGIVLSTGDPAQTGNGGAVALAFFSPSVGTRLRAGQSVRIQVGSSDTQLVSEIAEVEPGTSSPAAVLEHYGQQVNGSGTTDQQVVVVLLKSGPTFSAAQYVGNVLVVQVNAGSQSLFAAVTGISNL